MDFNDFNNNTIPTGETEPTTPKVEDTINNGGVYAHSDAADSHRAEGAAPQNTGYTAASTSYTAASGASTGYTAAPNAGAQGGYTAAPNYGGQSGPYYTGGQSYNAYSQSGSTPPVPPKQAPKRQKKSAGMAGSRVAALCVCCALVGGLVGGGTAALTTFVAGSNGSAVSASSTSLVESSRTAVLNTAYVDTTGQEMTAAQVYESNVNSCVGISVNITYNVWGYTTTSAASGSGFIISSDGYIITNYHVVEGGDEGGITVTLYDGTTYAATLVGYDSDNDVAVLKVEPETELTPVVLGDSDSLTVGDQVMAIGNPLGELTFSLTDGVVSALNREVTLSSGTMNLIQTDCAINSGNSGGPLFNSYGEVVGITNAKYSSSSSTSSASIDNIAFAIPINTVKSIVESIIENGYVIKPYLGVSLRTVDEDVAQAYGMTVGAYVSSVESGSGAEAAGIQQGDIITACDGEAVTSADAVSAAKNTHAAGETMSITVVRNGEEMTFDVVLGEQISTQDSSTEDSTTDSSSQYGSQYGSEYGTSPYGYSYGYGYGDSSGSSTMPGNF